MVDTLMFRNRSYIAIILLALIAFATCAYAFQSARSSTAATPKPTVIIQITSGPDEIFRIMSALRVAEDAINANRRVVLFFNGSGVTVPLKRLMPDLRLGDERTMWHVLQDLTAAGAEIVVAREPARTLGLVDADFLPQTLVGDWGGQIFSRVNSNTVVFSY